jgi:hypothetical protein
MALHPSRRGVPFLEQGRRDGEPPPTPIEMLRTLGLLLSGLAFMVLTMVVLALLLNH